MVSPKSLTGHEPDIFLVCATWHFLSESLGGLSMERTNENASKMMALLDRLVEASMEDVPAPGVEAFRDFVSDWVQQYEKGLPIQQANPLELLRHLMEANNLRQSDLAMEFGGQPAVSAVLRGRRQIILRQARALGKRFNLAPSAFIEESSGSDHETHGDTHGVAAIVMSEHYVVQSFNEVSSGAGEIRHTNVH